MIDLQHDIETVFYGPDFAAEFAWRRGGVVQERTVPIILGTQDVEALDGRVQASNRKATYPASRTVRLGDELVALEDLPDYPKGTVFEVLDHPQKVNDGLEMEALLGALPQ